MTFSLHEKTSGRYTSTLVDDLGVGVGSGSLTTFKLTLYDKNTLAIINGRNGQDALNNNNVAVDSSGNVRWLIQPLDNIILDDTLLTETHIALFEAVWSGGQLEHEVELVVRNLVKVS